MTQSKLDALTEGGQDYTYRDGHWTTKAGYCVSTTHAHSLTMQFYERHGRSPASEPRPDPTRRAKAAKARTALMRAAVAKAKRAKS